MAEEIFDGTLDIRSLTTKGRHVGIDVFILIQGNSVASNHGKAIRKNLSDVIAFGSCAVDLLDFVDNKKEWPACRALIEYYLEGGDQRVGVALANNTHNSARKGTPDKRLIRFKAGDIQSFHIPNGAVPAPAPELSAMCAMCKCLPSTT